MDSIISATLTEICSHGTKGISLNSLWPKLTPSLSPTNLHLSPSLKSLIYSHLLKTPNLQFKSKTSIIPPPYTKIQSFEIAEKLNVTIIASNHLLDCFYGLHDCSSAISDSQRKVLELLGLSKWNGISQCQIGKEIGVSLNKMEYVLKPLEIRGLIVRKAAILRRNNGGKVCTNLVYLSCYAKKLSCQQRLEVTVDSENNECSVKENVVVNDYVPAMKAVCEKLEEAEGMMLSVLDIKRDLGYTGKEGFSTWRNIQKRLKDAGLVEELKNGKCLRLLKKFDLDGEGQNSDDLDVEDSVETGKRNKSLDAVLELPIERQIYDMIDAGGRKGITVVEFCKRLGLSSKKIYIYLRGMVLRSEIRIRAESHNKCMQFRVWTTPNFGKDGSSNVVRGKPESLPSVRRPSDKPAGIGCNEEQDSWETVSGIASGQSKTMPPTPSLVNHGSILKYPSPVETAESVRREKFILKRLFQEKFILFSELYKQIVTLEKDKHMTMDKKTLKRKLSKLEQEGHCKCIQITSPHVTKCNRSGFRTVVLNKCMKGALSPELLGQLYERMTSSDRKKRQRGCSTQVKNKKVVSGSHMLNTNLETSNSYSKVGDSCIRKCQDDPNRYRDFQLTPQKRKRSSKAGSSKRRSSEERSVCVADLEDHGIQLHSCKENGEAKAERIPSTSTPDKHDVCKENGEAKAERILSTSTPDKHDERRKLISVRDLLSGLSSKLVNEGTNVSTLAYESLSVANAVELLKLVLLTTSSAPKGQNMLEKTLRQYSEHDLFAAFSYLKGKKFVAGADGNQSLALSRQFLHNISSSPFPVNTSERAAKFISCIKEKEKDLMEDEIHLDNDLQCGDLSHLLALIYSGSVLISPSLPDEGIGEGKTDFYLKRKTNNEKSWISRIGKKMKYPENREVIHRRAEAFPGIKVSVCTRPITNGNTSESQSVAEIKDDMGVKNSISSSKNPGRKEVAAGRSPWQAMVTYGEQLLSKSPDIEQRSLSPELFRSTYLDIYKAADQGLSMERVSHLLGSQGMSGGRMAEIVVEVLQAFGKSIKVNAFNDIRVVDASFRSKYLLTLTEGLNSASNTSKISECMASGDEHSSYKPILPWVNGDGTVNQVVYKGLVRRVLGIVMQNPGMLEDAVVAHMDVLNPQSCRKLLELMILDNHLSVRKVDQSVCSGVPSIFGHKSLGKSNSVCLKHIYAHPMTTPLL